jgi:hypothetical protein
MHVQEMTSNNEGLAVKAKDMNKTSCSTKIQTTRNIRVPTYHNREIGKEHRLIAEPDRRERRIGAVLEWVEIGSCKIGK